MAEFDFTDWQLWSNDRLLRRQAELEGSEKVPQSDTRAFMIARELLHITVEQAARQEELRQFEEATGYLSE